MKAGILKRELTRQVVPWLPNDLAQGTTVYEAEDIYGDCSPEEVSVRLVDDPHQTYYGIPADAVDWHNPEDNFHGLHVPNFLEQLQHYADVGHNIATERNLDEKLRLCHSLGKGMIDLGTFLRNLGPRT